MRVLVFLVGAALAGTAVRATPAPDEPERPAPRDCAAIEADARAMLENARLCDGACEVVSMRALVGDSCVAAFQCSAALPADVDHDAFVLAAQALDAEKRACGECAQAACVPPAELEARCVDGRCELARPDRPISRPPLTR